MHSLSDSFVFFIAALLLLGCCEFFYIKLAERFSIIDKPNERSSHRIPTIRGGGVIFLLGILFWFFFHQFQYLWFVAGAFFIGVISFMDDIREQPAFLRSAVHFIAIFFVLLQLNFFIQPWWLVLIVLIVSVGAINTFNFMDGINGITGIYALVNCLTFYVIDQHFIPFTNATLILAVLAGIIVFLFYNFRTKARCFAGDVGSVVLAIIQIFLLLQLIVKTGHYGWIVFFAVYGTDSVITILYRLIKKENIFKAHRTHLYQYLSNEQGYGHLQVSVFYGMAQLLINVTIIYLFTSLGPNLWIPLLTILLFGILYMIIRIKVLEIIRNKTANS